jgi:hypothetical protein
MEYKFKSIIGDFVSKKGEFAATTTDDVNIKFESYNAFKQYGDLMEASNYKKSFEEIEKQFRFMVKVQYGFLATKGNFDGFNYKKVVKIISEDFDSLSKMKDEESVRLVLQKI